MSRAMALWFVGLSVGGGAPGVPVGWGWLVRGCGSPLRPVISLPYYVQYMFVGVAVSGCPAVLLRPGCLVVGAWCLAGCCVVLYRSFAWDAGLQMILLGAEGCSRGLHELLVGWVRVVWVQGCKVS
ncbi:hypothetical protein U1Q18_015294 [Sarracenia purpurea var. burkii]